MSRTRLDGALLQSDHGADSSRSPPSTTTPATADQRIRRRNRVIASCLECRRRKLKCDKQAPCTNCTRFRRDCLYLAPTLDSVSQQKLAEIKDRMGTLEHTLERDVARRRSGNAASGDTSVKIEEASDAEDDVPEAEDEKNLEPTPLARLDQAYEDDADDELMDLGVQLGKMRVSDRIGGLVRPKLSEELRTWPNRGTIVKLMGSETAADHWLLADTPATYLGPGPEYLAPASAFFFPSIDLRSSLSEYLPSRNVCDALMDHYWRAVHTVSKIVHRPSFEQRYAHFWVQVSMGTEPPASTQAAIFAALLSAAVSLPDSMVFQVYGLPKQSLTERLQSSTEKSLSKANFLRTTKLETMQAFVMYLVPLCRSEVSRAHSALVGTAIRLAECMGLHKDGTAYSFTPVETHVRRLIWYQLCFLDIRTCEATGPRPQIRKGDFDTKLPLNVNEVDLFQNPVPVQDDSQWTDMTLSRIRFECTEIHRQLWIDNMKIDQKKTKLAPALQHITKARADIESRYGKSLQGQAPEQILANRLYRVIGTRPVVMLLHRYFVGNVKPMPPRLRKILIDACIASTENAIAIETQPDILPWAWYRGAVMQYHTALLLLIDVYHNPDSPHASRVWRCLDYIYELPMHMTSEQKADSVFFALRERLAVYQGMRKQKTTAQMEAHVVPISQRWYHNEVLSKSANPPAATREERGKPSMYPTQVGSPTNIHGSSESTGPVEQVVLPADSAAPAESSQVQAQGIDEMDWQEWEAMFPVEQHDFGMDLPDFDLGSWTSFTPRQNTWPNQPMRR